MIGDVRGRALRGTFLHAPTQAGVEVLTDIVLRLDDTGVIIEVRPATGDEGAGVIRLPSHTRVLPGFVDLHIHAPQYPQLGRALDVPLEAWLNRHTFPLEERYANLDFAHAAYSALVTDLLAGGTTTAVYYATIHVPATKLLADICLAKGQRAFIGKVAMDHPDTCRKHYRDGSAESALAETDEICRYISDLPGAAGRLLALITPRFLPACTDKLLDMLGAYATSEGVAVQTHCSESDWEHQHAMHRFGRSDTAVLESFGLLTAGGVLAHGVMLSEPDMERIVARGAGVAHCPLSNAYFANAVFPLRAALSRGVRVGLGTDISGGHSASMFDSCRMAVAASRMLGDGVDPDRPASGRGRGGAAIDFSLAWHLATAGGADILRLPVGRFQPGCRFDAMLIDLEAPLGTLRRWDGLDTEADVAQKILYGASRANIATVWVDGVARA